MHELEIERPRKTASDLALSFRQIPAIGVEPVRPNMRAAFGIDQLHVDQNLIATSTHAAFHDIANPQITPVLFRIDSFAFVGKAVRGRSQSCRRCAADR